MFRTFFKSAFSAALAAALMSSAFAADAPMMADRHMARGLKCDSCHAGGTPGPVPMNTCLACHGGSYKALAAKTDKADINPHDTHLENADCSQCHSGHKKPQLVCDQCHEFKMQVP